MFLPTINGEDGVVGLHAFIGVTVAASITLLYANFIIFSFFGLSTTRGGRSFRLCTLIPPATAIIFRASSVYTLIRRVGRLGYDQSGGCLCVSGVFSCLGLRLCALLRSAPRKLDERVDGVLLDFRRPSGSHGRILCYTLNSKSCRLIRGFVGGCYSDAFPSGLFSCGKRRVHVCPLPNSSFLTYCIASNFLTIDCRGGLVRRIVSTHLSNGSLLGSSSFSGVRTTGGDGITTAVCTQVRSLSVNGVASNVHSRASLNN